MCEDSFEIAASGRGEKFELGFDALEVGATVVFVQSIAAGELGSGTLAGARLRVGLNPK